MVALRSSLSYQDTARKKCNQTYRAHAPTRKVTFVLSSKVKVKASGMDSRNTKAKGKATRRAAMKVDETLLSATTNPEAEFYSTEKLFENLLLRSPISVRTKPTSRCSQVKW